MTYLPNQKEFVSILNSTSTPLSASEIFSGSAEDVSKYSQITITYNTDVSSSLEGLTFEFSPDSTNWDRKIPITAEPNDFVIGYGGAHALTVANKYFRVIYKNGSVGQSYFRLQTIYHTEKSLGISSRADQVINKHNDVQLVRSITDIDLERGEGKINYQSMWGGFGSNAAVGGTETDVWNVGGAYPFPRSAQKLRIRAGGNSADNVSGSGGQTVVVIGLDENFASVQEVINTSGSLASAQTTNSFFRVNRAILGSVGTYGGTATGNIIIENVGSGSILARIDAGNSRSEQTIYTVPKGKTGYLVRFVGEASQSNTASIIAYVRQNANDVNGPSFSPKIIVNKALDFSGFTELHPRNWAKMLECTDFWVGAIKVTGGGNAQVSIFYDILLVDDDAAS